MGPAVLIEVGLDEYTLVEEMGWRWGNGGRDLQLCL